MNPFRTLKFLSSGIALCVALQAGAEVTGASSPAFKALSANPANFSATAVSLVKAATPRTLRDTTIDVVKSAILINPAATAVIVGEISKASPMVAGTAVTTAVTLVPEQLVAVVKAAVTAAPFYVRSIVQAACLASPQNYQIIARAALSALPGSEKDILAGISAALPDLAKAISAANVGNQTPTLDVIFGQLANTPATGSSGNLQGPSSAPPLVPIYTTPVSVLPSSGGTIPSGGRGYASP